MGRGALLGLLSGLGDLLGSIFSGLFNLLVNQLLVPYVIQPAFRVLVTVIQYFTSAIFYEISKFLLGLVDFVEILFRALAGLPSTASSGIEITFSINGKSGDLLLQMLTSKEVLQVFYATAIVGVFLLIITTIFSMIKVEYTTEGAQNSKSSIIGKSLKSLCNMLIIPLLCVMGVFIGNQVLDLIDTATGGGQGTKISGTLWVTAASGAMLAKSGDLNDDLKVSDGGLLGAGIGLAITKGFESAWSDDGAPPLATLSTDENPNPNKNTIENGFMSASSGYNYYKVENVVQHYNPFEVNYLVLIFGVCIIIKCLYHTCFGLVDRLYQCTALFIVMPMVVGMSPVKDSLGSWRSKFISKALSAYGTVISLNLFFIIVRIMLNIKIDFGSAYDNWIFPKSFMAGLIKAIMVIVGCLMIEKLAGDLGGYFGGGNAMADGKGLAKEATAGVAKAAMAAGMVATGGASLIAKGAKGVGGLANKLSGGGAGRLANKVTGGISKGVHAATGFVGKGVGAVVHAPQNIGKKIFTNHGGHSGDAYYSAKIKTREAEKTRDIADEKLKAIKESKGEDSAEYKEQQEILNNANSALTSAQAEEEKLRDKMTGKEGDKKTRDAVEKVDKHFDKYQARDAYYEDLEKQQEANRSTRKQKITTNKEAVRQYVENKFGLGAAFKTFAPKSLQNAQKEYQDAYKQANSASPEGEAMMANIKKAKEDSAEQAYNSRNKRIIEQRNLEQLGLVFTAVNSKLAYSADETSKQLEKLAKILANLGSRYSNDKTKQEEKDAIMQQAYGVQEKMQQLNGKIEFDGAFKVKNEQELKVGLQMDSSFMQKMQEQIKKGVKIDDIMEQVKEEFKRMGLAGNDKLLNEIYKSLEELKNQVGTGK